MRMAFTLFAAGVILALAATVVPNGVIDVWLTTVLPLWSVVTSALFVVVPVSATLTAAVVLLVVFVLAMLRPGRRARRALALVVGGVGALTIAFMTSWGAAYYRVPVVERLGLPQAGVELAVLEASFDRLVAEVHHHAPEAALAGVDAQALRSLTRAAARCVEDLDETVSGRRVRVPTGVRYLPPGTLLRAGYGGISLPWLLEPHVDTGLPGAAFLMVATHELMHAAGWAREAETDALAVLAGLACDEPMVRYATALHGAALIGNSLMGLVPVDSPARARVREALLGLPSSARDDRRAVGEAVAHYRIEVAVETVGRAYDLYLRAHGVEAGVADYALAGAVLAAALAQCDHEPARPWCQAPIPPA
jgi:hypothetical protein